jgi:outer membrane murein-binding lipoprotein Lpp
MIVGEKSQQTITQGGVIMRSALIAAALLALVLCGCSNEQPEEVKNQIADMESELTSMGNELEEVKAMAGDLKSELYVCKDELQALIQEKMQGQAAAAEELIEEAPAIPDHPTEHPTSQLPDHPTNELNEHPVGATE